MLAGKTIVLGVSGGIAAYQTVELVGQLRRRLGTVHVIMTRSATHFITPLTLETVSLNPVIVDMFASPAARSIAHISLARAADIFLIAPATANIIGKIAHGIADDMLSTTVMATKAPVIIAPAMNENMWLNPIVQENVKRLTASGYHIVEPEYGEMACGGVGWGRLARIEKIISYLINIAKNLDKKKGLNAERKRKIPIS